MISFFFLNQIWRQSRIHKKENNGISLRAEKSVYNGIFLKTTLDLKMTPYSALK